MEITLTEPTRLYLKGIPESTITTLKSYLTYTNRSVTFQIEKFKHNKWFVINNGVEAYNQKLKELKEQQKVCLLIKDKEKGLYHTYPGLLEVITQLLPKAVYSSLVSYPEPALVPWSTIPPPLREYQKEAVSLLLSQKHAAIEYCTGSGKSLIALYLAKALGLKTIIMVPSINIGEQLYNTFYQYFGPKFVGFYGNGKKKYDKLFTIGIAASLTRLKEGTPEWEELSKAQVLIVDEAHTLAADTFEAVALGVCRDTPYRFSVSGTQARGDGSDMRLKGLIGPIVKRMSVKEGVDLGVLAKPEFRAFKTVSDVPQSHRDDAMAETRKHFYYNSNINKLVGKIVNDSVNNNKQVLVLIEEIEQFIHILPHLKYKVQFAHGSLTDQHKRIIPKEYQESDNSQLVNDFNNKKFPILVGSSAVSTGVDFTSVQVMVNLQAGKSFVSTSQTVGRCTRKAEGKDSCLIYDFLVENIETLKRHFWDRYAIYESIYPDVKVLKAHD